MLAKLRSNLTFANAASALALFVALSTGGAYAAHETIFSDDIVDGQVQNQDLGDDSVSTAKIQTQGVANSDIAPNAITATRLAEGSVGTSEIETGSVFNADIAPNSISSTRVANNSLLGEDIDEGSLGPVPFANVAGNAGNANNADMLDSKDSTEFLPSDPFGDGGNAPRGEGTGNPCTLGEIALTATNGANAALPQDFTPARGQLLPITGNTQLFAVLGTTYGGDGQSTFGLPDMRNIEPDNMTYGICIEGVTPDPPG